jgi:methionyl-tRNA formyltransferase
LRIVFMGTPQFAVPALQKLIDSHHEVVAVVTQPDRPVGRGRKIQPPAIKELALAANIPVLQPEKIRKVDFDKTLAAYQPDAIVVVAYGNMIPTEVIALPKYGCLNIHASLLPRYRGAAPIQWAIINGERHTGVTIMQIDEGMDSGNIVAFEQVDVLDDDDTVSMGDMLSCLGADLLIRALDQIEKDGKVTSVPQDHTKATMAPLLTKADGLVDWSLTNEEIICRIQGLQPWPTAFSYLHGRVVKFLRADPFEDPDGLMFPPPSGPDAKHQRPPDPGTITALVRQRGFTVKTGDGHLLVKQIQPQGKKPMSGVDAINGQLVRKGDLFISDPAFLEGSDEI